jgi:hypothetical protein
MYKDEKKERNDVVTANDLAYWHGSYHFPWNKIKILPIYILILSPRLNLLTIIILSLSSIAKDLDQPFLFSAISIKIDINCITIQISVSSLYTR